ncbi:hypothetical protein V8B97DRAFT_1915748 [Scleroderma yunnanense]
MTKPHRRKGIAALSYKGGMPLDFFEWAGSRSARYDARGCHAFSVSVHSSLALNGTRFHQCSTARTSISEIVVTSLVDTEIINVRMSAVNNKSKMYYRQASVKWIGGISMVLRIQDSGKQLAQLQGMDSRTCSSVLERRANILRHVKWHLSIWTCGQPRVTPDSVMDVVNHPLQNATTVITVRTVTFRANSRNENKIYTRQDRSKVVGPYHMEQAHHRRKDHHETDREDNWLRCREDLDEVDSDNSKESLRDAWLMDGRVGYTSKSPGGGGELSIA